MLKYLKIVKNIVYYIAIILLVLISLATASTVLDIPKGVKFLMVQSGSMEPVIKTGSVVVVGKSAEYKEGDIVTYLMGENVDLRNPTNIITHRIITVEEEGKVVTKGDANDTPDSIKITKNQIIGKVRCSIPFLGYGVSFAKSQTGFILLIIVPGTLIIYGELINVKNEIVQIFEKAKKKKKIKKKRTKKKNKKKMTIFNKIIVVFLLGFSCFYFSSTEAYLIDTEKNEGNIISAGIWAEENVELELVGHLFLLPEDIIQEDTFGLEKNANVVLEEILFIDTGDQLIASGSAVENIQDLVEEIKEVENE